MDNLGWEQIIENWEIIKPVMVGVIIAIGATVFVALFFKMINEFVIFLPILIGKFEEWQNVMSDEPPEELGASEVESLGPLGRYDDCDDHINLNSDFNTRRIGPVASSVTNQNFMIAVNREACGRPYQEDRHQHLFELNDHHYEAIRSAIKSSTTSLINAAGGIIGSVIRTTPFMMRSVIFIMGGIASAIGVIGPILLTTLSDLFKLMRSINIPSVRLPTVRFSTPDRSSKRKKGKRCESKPKQEHKPQWKSKEGHRPRSKPNERNRPSGMASRSATVPKSNPQKLSKWRKSIKTGAGKE